MNNTTVPVRIQPATDAITDTYIPLKDETAEGAYYCVITSTDDPVGVKSQAVTLTVGRAPKIKGNITSGDVTICEGGSVTLGVDAEGSALTYQWYEQKGTNKAPATDDKKGTSATYTQAGLMASAKFYCIVESNSVCTESASSNVVTVTVEKSPKITTQPVRQPICDGTPISLSVAVTDADHFQWYHNGTMAGGNEATLSNVTAEGVYTCVVSKSGGVCGGVTSAPVLITAAGKPLVSLGSRDNLTACQGELVTLPSPEVETGGTVIVPEKTGWYLSTATDPETAPLVSSFIAGNSDAIYHYKLTYKCTADEGAAETILTPAAGGMPTLAITVNTPLTITRQPTDVTVCNTTSALSLTYSGSPHTSYQWYDKTGTAVGGSVSGTTLSSVALGAGSYYCVVTNACGNSTSAVATVTVVKAPEVNLTAATLTYCPDSEVTLPTPSIETNGSVLLPAASGWATNTSGANLAATVKAPAAPGGSQEYYYCIKYTCGANPAEYVASTAKVTLQSVAKPVEPNLTGGSPASNTLLCDGEKVTLPVIDNKADHGRWELNGRSMGDLLEYKVHYSDNGQVFQYINADACGQETPSTVTYRLNVKQPVRITGTIATPVVREDQTTLNVPEPTSTGVMNKTWLLNNVNTMPPVDATTTVALANDKSLLTYRVDNGCTTPGSSAETSALLRVWKVPEFTGDGTATPMMAQVGNAYTFPAPPVVAMNNCEVVSQGWIVKGAPTSADKYLNPLAAANLSDNAEIAYRVIYHIPGSTDAKYIDSKTMGIQKPWAVPTISVTPGPIYAEAKAGAKWTMPVYSIDDNNTNVTSGWVYGQGHTPFDANTVDLEKHARQPLYLKVEYTLPDGSAGGTVYFYAGELRPWKAPEFYAYTAQRWDVCNTKTYVRNGKQFPSVLFKANECTISGYEWQIDGATVTEGDNPTTAHNGKQLEYVVNYTTPRSNSPASVKIPVATVYTVSARPDLVLNEAADGSPDVQVIGADIIKAFGPTVNNTSSGGYEVLYDRTYAGLKLEDQGKNITFTVENACGVASAAGLVELRGATRGHQYYAGIEGTFKTAETLDGFVEMFIHADSHVWRCRTTDTPIQTLNNADDPDFMLAAREFAAVLGVIVVYGWTGGRGDGLYRWYRQTADGKGTNTLCHPGTMVKPSVVGMSW